MKNEEINYPKKVEVTSKDGIKCIIHLTWVSNLKHITLRFCYGFILASLNKKLIYINYQDLLKEQINKINKEFLKKFRFEEMLDWPNKTIYILGIKRKATNIIEYRNSPSYFFYTTQKKFTSEFDEFALDYFKNRILYLVQNYRLNLPRNFTVNLSKYNGKFASYNTTRRKFSFDRRLMAFKPIVIDSVILHELCHVDYFSHDKNFYNKLYGIMPKNIYHSCREILEFGGFENEPNKIY